LILKKPFLIFLFLACCASAFAYTRITTTNGETPKWTSMPVKYWINEKGLSTIANGSDFAAIQASFRTWELVPSADVHLSYQGTTPVGAVQADGYNVITFSDTTVPLGSSTIAATFTWFRSEVGSDGVIHPAIGEADIAFNPNLSFSTSGEVNKFDVQSILTHEIGHFLGLDHSTMVSSVMVPFGVTSLLDQRTLAYDDIAGITDIYPIASAVTGLGQIRGTVRLGTAAVFGASVVAVNSDGTAVVSTLSQKDGTYILKYLPPGSYRVYAEPIDLPVALGNISGFYSTSRIDFGSTYFGNVSTLSEAPTVTVTAAGTAAATDIALLPSSTTGLNLTRPGFGARAARGIRGTLTVGGTDITAGVVFSASSPGLVLGSPTFGGVISSAATTSARMDLSIDPSTALGAKNIAVNRGADASILTGALVITDPNPSSIIVAPGNGPIAGNTPVTITGANFRPGAQIYFGGLAATSVSVVDAGTILANAPPNPPGTLNVVVVNSDGTWGVATAGFTYDAPPPVIATVTPLSGPPMTSVTITGQNFDSHIQNIAVQFNGIPSRVISATPTTITTVVPFGTTTGPITISVFGKPAIGPIFDVAQVSSSTNLAVGAFNFIDATALSGGTAYTFTDQDDGLATVTLPFNFSLFRDVYLAGSPITLTTNGFLSLESLAVVEYVNGPLPGTTVTRKDNSTGVIPPSLIAPFWDDLHFKTGSQVTVRTVGNAPNRQFVIEWSNLTILDENGADQNADVTFEAILFEGSNDIQFLYKSMSGPRSDGSSATIGAQNLQRTSAILSGFNQAIVSSGFFKTYHFNNGTYSEVQPDSTPPSKPVVTDEGALTANTTQLAASWTSDDPESGIQGFQYAIGTTPGGIDVKPFTSTTQNSAVVTGLNLFPGVTYYFAVKAINGLGLTSDVGVSDGIRFDPTYQPQIKIIPSAPESNTQFSGIALLAPTAMNVVLRAYDSSGNFILGPGIRNPATISLAAGQQYARVLSELFGLQAFDGWIEVEASASGLGIFTASGSWDLTTLDGSVSRDPSSDFVLFHRGATAIFVNPSVRIANVMMTALETILPPGVPTVQSFSIPPRGRIAMALQSGVHIQSSEALVAIERTDRPGKLAINSAVSATEASPTLVFPQAVAGGGYRTTVFIANLSETAQAVAISYKTNNVPTFGNVTVPANGMIPVPFPPLGSGMSVTAVQLSANAGVVAVLDIENDTGLVTIGARPAAKEFAFPHVANGNGLFTGLALATGASAASITIEVYDPSGALKGSGAINLSSNQQLARLVSEFVAGVATQSGGYIKVHSDQPIRAWEIYGSADVMASGPPL
jgi:Matrixin/IPT/TIG domain